ncbi:MAG: glycosyltransferase 87 family protein [Candidatus Hodarchaeota archaeon]
MVKFKISHHINLNSLEGVPHLRQYSVELVLLITGYLLFFALQILILLTNLVRSDLIFEIIFFVPFGVYIIAIFLLRRIYSENISKNVTRNILPIVLGYAILFQIIILSTQVSLSDDIFRFFYEGKAIAHGINPYIIPINDFPDYLKDNYIDQVNHAHITSPYPPLALLLFTVLYLISEDLFIFRFCFSFGFIVSILVCYKLIASKNKWMLIVYAWNPLFHLETANGSHFDVIVVLFVMLAVWCLFSDRLAGAGVFFLISFLLKYYPIFFVIVYWKQLGKRGLGIFVSGLVFYVIFILLVPEASSGLLIYAEAWYFNASIFWVMTQITNDFFISKIILGGIFVLLLCIVALKSSKESIASPNKALLIIAAFILFQPTLHPWYLFWLFPFVLLDKNPNFSWILLTGAIILSYHVYIAYSVTHMWIELDVFRLIEYIPFYIYFFIERRALVLEFNLYAKERIQNLIRSQIPNFMKFLET